MTEYTVEQTVQFGDCLLPPPIAVLTRDNEYKIKEKDSEKGELKEDSSFLCRVCCTPGFRTSKNKIKINGNEYESHKEFRLGYCISILPCMNFRPDVIVKKGGKTVGSVVIPCYDPLCCKLAWDVYKGENRESGDLLCKIRKCICNCHMMFGKLCGLCCDSTKRLEFEISDKDGKPVNNIRIIKEYNGLVNECFTMADKYTVLAPGDDDTQALLFAAVQFIDMTAFEMNYWGAGTI